MNKKDNESLREFNGDNSINQKPSKNNDLKLEKTAKIVAIAMFFILSILVFYIFLTFFNKKEIKFKQLPEGTFIYIDGIVLDEIDTIGNALTVIANGVILEQPVSELVY